MYSTMSTDKQKLAQLLSEERNHVVKETELINEKVDLLQKLINATEECAQIHKDHNEYASKTRKELLFWKVATSSMAVAVIASGCAVAAFSAAHNCRM
jgi:hypothetical protein